jgi:D-apionolactonase
MISSSPNLINDLQILKAGVFSVGYRNGFIRHIHYGEVEVVRSIYMALRDQNWFTYEHTIENEIIQEHDDHFEIQYDCFYELNSTRIFQWHVQILGTSDSTITFEVNGEALTDVLKNRAGICVLHPIQYTAGHPCELLHPDGSQIKKIFPVMISAENPFKDLRGFRWRCQYHWYVLHFEGDVFETEDQRNWCDASYKTFCTPLARPFPVVLKEGEKVHQKVIFKAESNLPSVPFQNEGPIEIVVVEKKYPLPKIGLAASTETDALSPEAIKALISLNLSHYRVDVQPSLPGWLEKFNIDLLTAKSLALPLEIALHIADTEDLRAFCSSIPQKKPDIARIVLLSVGAPATTQSLIDHTELLRRYFNKVDIGAGTDYNYRELNCNVFDASNVDFVTYCIDPQEHATDDLTIIENIAAQADTVRSARNLYGESKAISIGSLTLKKRFNPAATVTKDRILTKEQRFDPRQQTLFAAAFTLGSIKTLAQSNANSVTLFQTVGSQGILSPTDEKYPVYDVLCEILSGGSQVIHTHSIQPLDVDALLLQKDSVFKLIMANYTSSVKQVMFRKTLFTLQPHEIRIEKV